MTPPAFRVRLAQSSIRVTVTRTFPAHCVAPALRFSCLRRRRDADAIRVACLWPDVVIRTDRTPSGLEVPVKSGKTAGSSREQEAASVYMPLNRRRARSGEA